jgi:hypothetical protein
VRYASSPSPEDEEEAGADGPKEATAQSAPDVTAACTLAR